MASNQVSKRRATGDGQGRAAARRPTAESLTKPSRDYGPLGNVADRATEYYERGEESLRECMSGREGTAVLVSLAAGLGVGLVIGAALGRSHRQTMSWRDRVAAEGFGQRLRERFESMIPEAIAEHFAK